MFSTLRTRFGIPGVISVVALVFAMLGGAYAASNSSGGGKATASAKAKKGPRGPKGATGPAGPAGAQGPAGANGKDGANGANGSNGAAGAAGATGKSVTTGNATAGECPEGGATVEVEGTPASKKKVCNGAEGAAGNDGAAGAPGAEGSPWVVGQAPAGAVLKGTWSIQGYTAAAAGEEIPVAISTGVPINSNIFFSYVPLGGPDPFPENPCKGGTPENPTVTGVEEVGQIVCIYSKGTEGETNVESPTTFAELNSARRVVASGAGLIVMLKSKEAGPVKAWGSWALLTN